MIDKRFTATTRPTPVLLQGPYYIDVFAWALDLEDSGGSSRILWRADDITNIHTASKQADNLDTSAAASLTSREVDGHHCMRAVGSWVARSTRSLDMTQLQWKLCRLRAWWYSNAVQNQRWSLLSLQHGDTTMHPPKYRGPLLFPTIYFRPLSSLLRLPPTSFAVLILPHFPLIQPNFVATCYYTKSSFGTRVPLKIHLPIHGNPYSPLSTRTCGSLTWTCTSADPLAQISEGALLTGQLADKPSRGQSSRGLVNSPTTNF